VVRESDLQSAIEGALRAAGLTVLHTSAFRARGPLGTTPGVPDLLVSCGRSPLWLGLEVKTPRGRLSPAQKELAEEGRVVVVRSVEDAAEACLLHIRGLPARTERNLRALSGARCGDPGV
jgi:hypothetical protein